MSTQKMLAEKTKTAAQVASLVNTGDTLDYGFGLTQPDLFDTALAEQKERLSNVMIRGTL